MDADEFYQLYQINGSAILATTLECYFTLRNSDGESNISFGKGYLLFIRGEMQASTGCPVKTPDV